MWTLLSSKCFPEIARRGLAEYCDVFCEASVFSVDQTRRIMQRAQELGFKLRLHADEMTGLGGAELAGELRRHPPTTFSRYPIAGLMRCAQEE